MNDHCTPSALQKAANCFFVLLDSQLNLTHCNAGFQSLFTNKTVVPGNCFLDLFSSSVSEQWKNALQNEEQAKQGFKTVTITIETEKGLMNVDWNIFIQKAENGTEFIEILGVPAEKKDIEETATISTAVARQETRFKSVLSNLKKVLNSSLDIICVIDSA